MMENILPLTLAQAKKAWRIISIGVEKKQIPSENESQNQKVYSQLAHLGMLPGTEVRLLRNAKRGPLMLESKGARMALGRELASVIMVQAIL